MINRACVCICLCFVTGLLVEGCRPAELSECDTNAQADSASSDAAGLEAADSEAVDVGVSDASQLVDSGEVLDCNAQLYRGYCIDALVPTGWGFDARCPHAQVFKPWVNGLRNYWSGDIAQCGKVYTETYLDVYCCE